jgi:hypothetical protein
MDDDDEAMAQDDREKQECEECEGAGCDKCQDDDGEEEEQSEDADGKRAANTKPVEVRTEMAKENVETTSVEKDTALVELGKYHGEEDLAREFALEGKTEAELRSAILAKRKKDQRDTPEEDPVGVASRQGGSNIELSRSAISGLKSSVARTAVSRHTASVCS